MSWEPQRLLEDVETKPAMLRGLATALRDGTGWPDLGRPRAVLLLGIGSSRYAAEVAARRMRSQGIAATAESSSIARVTPIADDTLVVVISAGGSSPETLAAARAVSTSSRVIGLTNAPSSVLAEVVGWAVPMDAGEEVSGVASRTF
ncbi:MAG TPA: SIS domain-containing protein, partial [Desertimonas sp.]|nr:SIS domain-containing protein [Desertimonas sp.]